MKHIKYLLLIVVLALSSMAFICHRRSSDPDRGFDISVVVRFLRTGGGGYEMPSVASTSGSLAYRIGSTQTGTVTYFDRFVNDTANIRSAVVPGHWFFRAVLFQPNCFSTVDERRNVYRGDRVTLACITYAPPFRISPESIDVNAMPGSLSIEGPDMSTQYGMPQLAYHDPNGNLAATSSASSVSKSNSPDNHYVMSTNAPARTAFYSNGTYTVLLNNVEWDGTWRTIGIASLEVTGNIDEPPDNPPDPCPYHLSLLDPLMAGMRNCAY